MLLTVAYDGTGYSGYQAQPGQRTIEGCLTKAVARMNGAALKLRAASRTDAGVHALGQRVAFDPDKDIQPLGWLRGINEQLPGAIRVRHVQSAPPGFEPRFQASHKRYRYRVSVGPVGNPLERLTRWHLDQRTARPAPVPRRSTKIADWLDLPAMAAAAQVLVGTHDFAAFQAANDPREQTVRTLARIDVQCTDDQDPPQIDLVVTGNAFLKNMVRIIAGSLVEVGRERMTASGLQQALTRGDRRLAGPTAPPHGLVLEHVELVRGAR